MSCISITRLIDAMARVPREEFVPTDRRDVAYTDITYIPMARGFVYLIAIVDWFSRRVLGGTVRNFVCGRA